MTRIRSPVSPLNRLPGRSEGAMIALSIAVRQAPLQVFRSANILLAQRMVFGQPLAGCQPVCRPSPCHGQTLDPTGARHGPVLRDRATSNVAGSRQLQAVTYVSPVSCVAVGNAVGTAGYEVTLVKRYSGEDVTRRVWGHGFASRSPRG